MSSQRWNRLVFFGTRALPALFIAGAVHLTIQEIFNPMSPERLADLEARRRRRRPSSLSAPPQAEPVPSSYLEEGGDVISTEKEQ